MSIMMSSRWFSGFAKLLNESGFYFFVALGHGLAWVFCPIAGIICYLAHLGRPQDHSFVIFWMILGFLVVVYPGISLLRLHLNPSLRGTFDRTEQIYWRRMALRWNVICLPVTVAVLIFRKIKKQD